MCLPPTLLSPKSNSPSGVKLSRSIIPTLTRMLDAGRAEAEGNDVVYAVCEYPDDVLSSVVQERPLSSDEALEVLHALRSALGFLHENGFAHGAVEPSHIMAFGDRIKLPSDTVRRSGAQAVPAEPTLYDAPEVAAGSPVTPAADMWSLGVTLREVLAPEQQNATAKPNARPCRSHSHPSCATP